MRILGWAADLYTGSIDDTTPISASSTIKLPVGQLAVARQTSNVTLGGNLNSETPIGGIAEVTFSAYDSLGVTHPVTITFTKTANDGEWTWDSSSIDGTIVGSGTMTFDANGKSTVNSGTMNLTLTSPNGATNPIDVTLGFQSMTQIGSNSGSTVNPASQDGLGMGVLNGFTVDKNGTINGTFDNGMTQVLGRIAMAQFSNPAGLSQSGNNLFSETGNSGLPQIGKPGTGSLGNLASGFLESSNVDLPTEFANMIVAQRGFQANSRIITTSDEILQELVQLKR
jgi:flagellar hook protein FlgE